MAIINIFETGNPSNNSEIEFYIETPEILDAYFAEKKEEKTYDTTYEIYKVKNKSETLKMLAAKFKSVLTGKALEKEIVFVNGLTPNKDGEYVLLQERQLAIPIKKEIGVKVRFEPISQIPVEKEVFMVVETNNLRRKTIQTYILEGNETTSKIGVKNQMMIDSNGQTSQFVEARVGAWSVENNVVNKTDFRDWAISTLKLPNTQVKDVYLVVDAFSANEYFNRTDNRMEKLDYRGTELTKFGIENAWFGIDDEPYKLV